MEKQDEKWHALLRWSGGTFEAETTPPYGFITAMMARLNSEKRQQEMAERIGWRAVLAAFAALAITAGVTFAIAPVDRSSELDPGVRGLVVADNTPIL